MGRFLQGFVVVLFVFVITSVAFAIPKGTENADPVMPEDTYHEGLMKIDQKAEEIDLDIEEMEVYLPKDKWVHFWTGKNYTGGKVTVPCKIGYPPVFYRKISKFSDVFIKTANLNII